MDDGSTVTSTCGAPAPIIAELFLAGLASVPITIGYLYGVLTYAGDQAFSEGILYLVLFITGLFMLPLLAAIADVTSPTTAARPALLVGVATNVLISPFILFLPLLFALLTFGAWLVAKARR